MNAMILAAGLGTRLRPLSAIRAKPALPVRGRPVISLLLEFLASHGITRVMINLHYMPETVRRAVDSDHPNGMEILWSEEPQPLGTGGGIRRASEFLRETEECVVLAGDMLLDVDLGNLLDRHRASGRRVTLLLREDPREQNFGTIGIDSFGRVRRVGEREVALLAEKKEISSEALLEESLVRAKGSVQPDMSRGLFTGLRIFSREALDHWPDDAAFEDLRDWLVPGMEERGESVGAEIVAEDHSVWEPVGTPSEYLRVNLTPPALPALGGKADHWGGSVDVSDSNVIDRSARCGPNVDLARCVVWDHEEVPANLEVHDGVFAGSEFHSCLPQTAPHGGASG